MQKKRSYNFKGIIFDMDGVITNTMPFHFDAWLQVFSSAGIKVNCYDVYKREGQDGLTTLKEVYKERQRKFNPKEAKLLLAQKEGLFKRIVRVGFVRGARPFLRALKKHRIALALVTGTSRHEAERIMPKSLLDLFAVTVTGDEVKKGKPHPEPFLRALKMLAIPPKNIAVIENAPFGIGAAKRARLFCIALETSLPHRYLKKADAIFKSYAELKKAVRFKDDGSIEYT